MAALTQFLSNPIVAVASRVALGGCVIYMARILYVDPMAYFRNSARAVPDTPWVRQVLRSMACFCLWGGCFIIVTAIAVQILDLRGDGLAAGLASFATIAAWFLLPKHPDARAGDDSGADNLRKPK
jgi:hypothetical protein